MGCHVDIGARCRQVGRGCRGRAPNRNSAAHSMHEVPHAALAQDLLRLGVANRLEELESVWETLKREEGTSQGRGSVSSSHTVEENVFP